MKKLITILIIILAFGVCYAQDTTSTSIETTNVSNIKAFDFSTIEMTSDYAYIVGNKGKPRQSILVGIKLISYADASTEYWDVKLSTDIKSVHLIPEIAIIPASEFIKNAIGEKNGKIKLPVLDTIVDKFVDIRVGQSIGYNWKYKDSDGNNGRWESATLLTILRKTWK
jgi:hypothetical protein